MYEYLHTAAEVGEKLLYNFVLCKISISQQCCVYVLQPPNLFVVPCDSTTEKGKSHLLKLADFGLCRSLTQDISTHKSSSIGMLNVLSDAYPRYEHPQELNFWDVKCA